MKEIALRLVDGIADYISNDAKEMGLTSEELVKYIVGTYVQCEKREAKLATPRMVVGIEIDKLMEEVKGDLNQFAKGLLKRRAATGDLKCKNCTMSLTEQDVDDDKCNTCGAPLKEALGGP